MGIIFSNQKATARLNFTDSGRYYMIPLLRRMKPREGFLPPLAAAVSLALFHWAYSGYFPNPSGRVGIDFTYFLPRLLDGYYWFKTNGLLAAPWFTPSFCGGIPAFANPQNLYYSFPQVMTIFTDPMKSVYLTILVFELFGFFGFYFLLRGPFGCAMAPALTGAGLFMFNGFYIHRLITGHLAYHAYMLVPALLFLLLRPLPPGEQGRTARLAQDTIAAGFIFAYMVYSGMSALGLPMLLSVILLGLAHGAIFGNDRIFWMKLALAGGAGVLLAASKLAAMGAFAHNFPRDFYPRLGIDNPFHMAWLLVQTLFFWPDRTLIREALLYTGGKHYAMSFQYYEFSVSPGPLLILIAGAMAWARRMGEEKERAGMAAPQMARLGLLLLIIILPVFLSYNLKIDYLDALIKKVPILGSQGHYTTWFMIYIPLLIAISMFVLDRRPDGAAKWGLILFCPLALLGQISAHDMTFYNRQYYDPQPVVDSYQATREGRFTPSVDQVRKYPRPAMRGWGANTAAPFGGDDYLTQNASQMLCYEPIFGYWREKFPLGPMKPGPAMALEEGHFNLKNPACFTYPQENSCRPGDHFLMTQRDSAQSFRSYKPFEFAMPLRQKAANMVSLISLLSAFVYLSLYPLALRRR